jgi:transcriptional regulator with XRE-family HTH domain
LAMDAVASWDGGKADTLRRALRMTNEQFAEHLGIAVRTVAYWRKNPEMVPLPATQEILDAALANAPEQAKAQFWLLRDEGPDDPVNLHEASPFVQVQRISAWLSSTNVSDDAVDTLAQASRSLARAHIQAPPRTVLSEVLRLNQQAQSLLQGGRQKLRQTRKLMRINSALLAHACLLFGDLGQNRIAVEYGSAALLFAREAEADEAIAWSVKAKTARWQSRYVEAADMARRGFEVSRLTPTRIELAYREALSAALLGDSGRSREALERAERTAGTLPANEDGISVWSFPIERQAVFGMSVALQSGDPDTALRAAATADSGWAAGDPRNPANWAQVRIGAAMAHLMNDSLDGLIR